MKIEEPLAGILPVSDCFVMDCLKDGRVTVYLTSALKQWSGNIFIMEKSRIEETEMTFKEALHFING